MKTNEIILYDSYYSLEKEESAREFLFELEAEDEGWKSPDDIPDERVFNQMHFQDETDWDDIKHEFEKLFQADDYLMTGYCGTWHGRLDGGSFICSMNDFLRVIEHLDDLRVIDRDGHLIIEGSHHDGSDSYELKRLTHKGYLLADSNYFAKDRDLHNTIMRTNFYSALPYLAKRIDL